MQQESSRGHALGRRTLLATTGALVALLALAPPAAHAASAQELTAQGREGLNLLYSESPKAAELGKRAKGILVFPNIVKAGALVGGQGGEGVLFVDGQPRSFHRIYAGSFGYQLGVQRFGYALFFINEAALAQLKSHEGWAVGSSPSLVLVDQAIAKNMNTMTLKKDVYVMSFSRRGLMAGSGIEGSKITEITPDR